jgi:hypothetical protein
MDTKNDFLLRSTQIYEQFGWCVAGAGDVTGDGYLDFLVGGNRNVTGGSWSGRASLYSQVSGIYKPRLRVNNTRVWNETAYLNGTRTSANFAPELNAYLRNATVTATDLYGNSYVDVPVCVTSSSDGSMTVSNLSIRYAYNATTNNFSSQLNWYVVNHRAEAGADGNLSVPLVVSAKSAGNLTLANLSLTIDEAPRLLRPIQDPQMEENTVAEKLVDLYDYFIDD